MGNCRPQPRQDLRSPNCLSRVPISDVVATPGRAHGSIASKSSQLEIEPVSIACFDRGLHVQMIQEAVQGFAAEARDDLEYEVRSHLDRRCLGLEKDCSGWLQLQQTQYVEFPDRLARFGFQESLSLAYEHFE